MTQKTSLDNLLKAAHDAGISVEFVPSSKLHDFAAMNWMTARIFGIPDFPDRTIWIDRKFSKPGMTLKETEAESLWHDLYEADRMLHGDPYWKAHEAALRIEDAPTTPFIVLVERRLAKRDQKSAESRKHKHTPSKPAGVKGLCR